MASVGYRHRKCEYAARARDRLLPDEWEKLAPVVDSVLDAPVERRAAVLADVSGGNPDLRAALEPLVAECEREMLLNLRAAALRESATTIRRRP